MNSKDLEIKRNELEKAILELDSAKLENTTEYLLGYYYKQHNFKEFIELLQRTIPIFEKTHPIEFTANKYFVLGKFLKVSNRLKEAQRSFHKAEAYFKLLDDKLALASVYMHLGNIHLLFGEYETSMDFAMQSLELFELEKDILETQKGETFKTDYGSVFETLGILFGKMEQRKKSREYFNKAVEVFQQTKFYQGEIQCLQNIGVTYSDEDPNKTINYYFNALELAKENNFNNLQVAIINNIGGVYEDISKYDQALKYYDQALGFAKKYQLEMFVSIILKHVATVYYKMEQFDSALIYLNESLKQNLENNLKSEILENYQLFSKIYQGMGNYKSALEFSQKCINLKDEIFNQKLIDRIGIYQKKYEETNQKLIQTKKDFSLISNALKKSKDIQFIGRSKAIQNVMELAIKVAKNANTNVLITGESGTGKEIIAKIVHFASLRKDKLLVPVNCSAIPEQLLESQFFGHKKGSFTGATNDEIGYFQEANNGSLFLDEIADMPISMQSKLLRVLESREVRGVGSHKSISIDFRLISATNKNIPELIKENKFRADLFYRINTFEIHIPPLRERKEDIEVLLDYFVKKFADSMKKKTPKIDSSVIKTLTNYDFPGNVRELRNIVEKAIILLSGDVLTPDHFDLHPKSSLNILGLEHNLTLEDVERMMIVGAMKRANNNQTLAAKQLGISYSTLYRKLKKFNIRS